jgi:hypothetical protein
MDKPHFRYLIRENKALNSLRPAPSRFSAFGIDLTVKVPLLISRMGIITSAKQNPVLAVVISVFDWYRECFRHFHLRHIM